MSTANDTRAPWTYTGEAAVGKHYLANGFVIAPQFAAPLLLNGTINATVYLNQSGSAPTGGSITFSIDEVTPSGGLTPLGTGPTTGTGAIGPGGSVPAAVFLIGPTIHATIPTADSIRVNFSIVGNTAEGYGIWWGLVQGTYYVSTVSIPVSSYLEVPSVQLLNATGMPTSVLPTDVANKSVTVVATVTDPLGTYDFESFPVDLSILPPSGGILLGIAPMNASPGLPPPGAFNGTYQRTFNYSSLAPGAYTFTVNVTDNTGHELLGQNTLPTYFGRNALGRETVSVGLTRVPVVVKVVDDHEVPLARAQVLISSAEVRILSVATNQTGVAAFELTPEATYGFSVTWEGVLVGSFPETVVGPSNSFILHAAVVYPTFQIVSAVGQPLAYSLVTLVPPNGTVSPLIVANGSGEFSLAQVPAGNYSMTVIYEGGEVLQGRMVPTTSDGPILVVVASVYPFTVRTVTSTGSGLPDVFVAIVNVTSGSTVASGITGNDGTLAFLLPAGTYLVTGHWAATYYLSPVEQTVRATVVLTNASGARLAFSNAYPAFTSTNEFFLVLGYGVLIVLLSVLVALVARRRMRSRGDRAPPLSTADRSAPAPASPPSGPSPPGKRRDEA